MYDNINIVYNLSKIYSSFDLWEVFPGSERQLDVGLGAYRVVGLVGQKS